MLINVPFLVYFFFAFKLSCPGYFGLIYFSIIFRAGLADLTPSHSLIGLN